MMLLVCLGALLFAALAAPPGSTTKGAEMVTLPVGGRGTVRGGKVKLRFVSTDAGPRVEIECETGKKYVQVLAHEPTAACCGIRLQVRELKDTVPLQAVFEVTAKD